jgi:antitoxin component of MazEF toxin-antitoxin module
MIKRLIKHGNSRAIVVDKAILEAAGIPEDVLFQISVNPSGGLVIQSVLDIKLNEFRGKFKELNKQHKKLMQNLADL